MSNEEKNKKKVKEKKKRTPLQKIVNGFLYAGIGILLLLIILFGFSQTSTFREFLREKIVEEANDVLNGKLYIEKIDGTIFTSLILRNTAVTMEDDTLFSAEAIGVLTSPLHLLLKDLHIRHFEIKNASLNLKTNEAGELNIERLLPPSEEEELDTTKSEFPFTIHAANLELNNFNFSFKDYSIKNTSVYDTLNSNDLVFNNINLKLAANVILKENFYELALNHLSFNSNVNGFAVNNLHGGFLLTEEGIDVHNLYLKTTRSEIMVNAAANNINLFDTVEVDLQKTGLMLQCSSNEFSFDDLRALAPSIDMLNGKIAFELSADGTTEKLNLQNILVSLENSKIEGSGELTNLLEEEIIINADFSGSHINQDDIKNLLAGTEIPVYPELGVIQLNTLNYNGGPLNFKSELNISTDKGNISGLVNLNLDSDPIQYDINLATKEVDIEPFAGLKSSINLSAEIKGRGVDPETFDGFIRLYANGSTINGNNIDTLRLTANAENKFIQYELRLASDETIADLKGSFDFVPEEPVYQVEGEVLNLNLAEFVQDTTMESNLNLTLIADGDGFNQDDLDLFLSATLYNSNFGEVKIDSTRMIVDIRSDPDNRIINIISDLADITIMGNFKVEQAVDLVVSEITLLSTAFNEKIGHIIPASTNADTETKAGLKTREPFFVQLNEPVDFSYLIDLKDFSLVSAFIGTHNLDIDAEMSGRFESTIDSVYFSFNTNLKYIKLWNDQEAFFISNMILDLDVLNNSGAVTTSDLIMNLNISAERIFPGSEISNLVFNLNMKEDVANIELSAIPEPYATKLIAEIDVSRNILDLSIDSLRFVYGNFEIINRDNLTLTYDGNRLDIHQFRLMRNNSEFNIKGFLSETNNQDLEINLIDWRGEDIGNNFLDVKPENIVQASINLNANITGSFDSPVINAKFFVDSIAYGNKNFGELESIFNYRNRRLDINLAFVDSLLNNNDTALTIRGYVPIDLSFSGAEENFMESSPMNITLHSNGFNLGAFGDLLPNVNKLRGEFSSDLVITGTPSSLKTEGYLRLDNAAFFLETNNLEYNTSMLINIDDKHLKLDSLFIANAPGTRNGGKITGSGSAIMDNFNITSSKFSFSGDLKVLSDASRYASAAFYGELTIGIDGNVELHFEDDRMFIQAPILIKRGAHITIPQTQSAYQSGSANYIYHFVEDTITPGEETEIGFERLVEISQRSEEDEKVKAKAGIFDYDISVKIEEEAEVTFVLSRELNQNLLAVLSGKIRLESYGARSKTEGKMQLMEGSTIQFLKTLEAEGSIDFRSGELSNPYLDIVATYFDYYYPLEGPDAGESIPVEVRLSITGPLSDLSNRLVTGEDNFRVYFGAQNIADNTPSPQYDASDAAMFILFGKFNNDATQQERNALASTAAALAGSIVGGFLNEQFGDAIRSVELRQVGTATVISLVGRWGKVRYEVGTSTDVYQDLSRANVRIQYPVTRQFFLRLERKESINKEAVFTTEMINEVGIKYLFEF